MTDLVEFLRARLDEDERLALECAGAPWSTGVPGAIHVDAKAIAENKFAYGHLGYIALVEREQNRQHIARHDPAHVLAEVEAKRRLVELHGAEPHECVDWDAPLNAPCTCYELDCPTLRLLALPYTDHPDYRPEWKP